MSRRARTAATRALRIGAVAGLLLAFTVLPGPLAAHGPDPGAGSAAERRPAPSGHDHVGPAHGVHQHGHDAGEHESHVHVPVPPEYSSAHVPAAAWTHPRLLARGRDIYMARCAVCHGERGDGRGPAAAGLSVPPANFRDVQMVEQMAGNYWFWRVSEGGVVEPFRSAGSAMPAWKNELSIEDRWAVIAYQHTLSGHAGPHVTSEHPERAKCRGSIPC